MFMYTHAVFSAGSRAIVALKTEFRQLGAIVAVMLFSIAELVALWILRGLGDILLYQHNQLPLLKVCTI